MGLRPLADRMVVRLEKAPENVTATGIVLPGEQDKFTKRAIVEAIGSKVEDVSVGETVILSGFAGNEIPGEEGVRVIREGEVLVVVTA